MEKFNNLFSDKNEKTTIFIKVKAQAHESKILGKLEDGTWKIAVKAPRENGKANSELIQFLSKLIGIKKENIKIISGHTQEYKKIIFNG
jgi:uncharacterized protein